MAVRRVIGMSEEGFGCGDGMREEGDGDVGDGDGGWIE